MSQDAPSDTGELVGERDGKDVVMQSLLRRFDPGQCGFAALHMSANGTVSHPRPV